MSKGGRMDRGKEGGRKKSRSVDPEGTKGPVMHFGYASLVAGGKMCTMNEYLSNIAQLLKGSLNEK